MIQKDYFSIREPTIFIGTVKGIAPLAVEDRGG